MSERDPMQPIDGDPDATAAEFVLGLLDEEEARAAERRMEAEPAFARDVALWWDRLSPLLEEAPEREPPSTLWPRIEAALERADAPAPTQARGAGAEPGPSSAKAAGPTPGAPAQFQAQPRRKRESRPDAPRRGGAGRLLAAALAGAVAASAATVGVMVYRARIAAPAPEGGAPTLVATLYPEAGEPMWIATYEPVRRRMVVAPTRVLPSDGHAHELWIIPEGGQAVSAGLLSPEPKAMDLEGDLLRMANAGATLAVTLEPPGGAPEGVATGPVIAKGALMVAG